MVEEKSEKKPKHRLVSWLLIGFKLIGIGLFVYLLWVIDFDELKTVFANIDLTKLLLAVLINLTLMNTLKIFRWYLIVRWMGEDYSFGRSYQSYQSAIFMGIMTPGRMGELMRSVYLKIDCGTPIYKGIASVLTDRVFDLMGLLTLAGLALLWTPAFGEFSGSGWYFIGAALLVAAILTFLRFYPDRNSRAAHMFGNGFLAKTIASQSHQLKSFTPLRLMILVVVTVLSLLTYASQAWLIADALGLNLQYITAAGVGASSTMVEVLPITVYGLGTREATYISLLGIMGVSKSAAFSFSMTMFVNFWIGGGLWALIFWMIKPINAKKLVAQFKRETKKEDAV